MSLAIHMDKIQRVLLVDGWHTVQDDSFDIDAYEYIIWPDREEFISFSEGSGITYQGFGFRTVNSKYLCGPMTSILAVEMKKDV